MIDRLMRWLGYVPLKDCVTAEQFRYRPLDGCITPEQFKKETELWCEATHRLERAFEARKAELEADQEMLNRLMRYAHVQKIIANMDKGTAKY